MQLSIVASVGLSRKKIEQPLEWQMAGKINMTCNVNDLNTTEHGSSYGGHVSMTQVVHP